MNKRFTVGEAELLRAFESAAEIVCYTYSVSLPLKRREVEHVALSYAVTTDLPACQRVMRSSVPVFPAACRGGSSTRVTHDRIGLLETICS